MFRKRTRQSKELTFSCHLECSEQKFGLSLVLEHFLLYQKECPLILVVHTRGRARRLKALKSSYFLTSSKEGSTEMAGTELWE